MALQGLAAPRAIISVNGALLPFGGVAGVVFSPLAKLIAANETAVKFFARMGRDGQRVASTLSGTGSTLDETGLGFYRRLFANEAHVANALQMMAGWDLAGLKTEIKSLRTPLVLIAAGEDRAVPAEVAFAVRDLVPDARLVYLRKLGHLAHEERPTDIAEIIRHEAAARAITMTDPGPNGDDRVGPSDQPVQAPSRGIL
jgi:magnesium chelatase accessory protein